MPPTHTQTHTDDAVARTSCVDPRPSSPRVRDDDDDDDDDGSANTRLYEMAAPSVVIQREWIPLQMDAFVSIFMPLPCFPPCITHTHTYIHTHTRVFHESLSRFCSSCFPCFFCLCCCSSRCSLTCLHCCSHPPLVVYSILPTAP